VETKALQADMNDKKKEANWSARVLPKLSEALARFKEPVYCVVDFRFTLNERHQDKFIFIGW
jgi:hypothetical protein